VRSAFIVSDKQTKKPKGVGYVSFAMKEDAENAFGLLSKNEFVLDGRVLRADWAGRVKKNKDKVCLSFFFVISFYDLMIDMSL
jgi:nucleolar protein 4